MPDKNEKQDHKERETIRRQFHMLRMLNRTSKVSTKELRSRLEGTGFSVTERTIQRDLRDLSAVFPIVCDADEQARPSKPYGWSWKKDEPACDLGGLTIPEALAFQMLARFGTHFLPAGIEDCLQPYFRASERQLNASMGATAAKNWARKIRSVPPTQPLLPAPVSENVQQAVHASLMKNCCVKIRYRSEKAKQAIVHPLGLVEHGRSVYLAARFESFDDARLLALHRISSVELLEESPASAPDGFDLDKYIADGAMGFGELGKSIRLQMRIRHQAGRHLIENRLSADQTIDDPGDGKLLVTATVNLTERLRWWLLGFGGDVEVLAPDELRQDIKKALEEAASRYR